MKVFWIVLLTLVLLGIDSFFLINYLKPKPGGVYVSTKPNSSVYINGNYVGKTPFKNTYDSGVVTIKLVPETNDLNLIPFETKVTLVSGIQTVIRREFGKTEDESSGDIISFEKENGKSTSLIVISTPDNAQVLIDGVARGFTPHRTSTISPAEHQITIKASDYIDRTLSVKTLVGYRLTVFAKLAKNLTPVSTPIPISATKTYIEILQTPTGFLRVRTEPGTKGGEIAEVKPGSKYLLLDTDLATGWYKIQYEDAKPGLPDGISGWVSNEFAKISTP